MPGIVVVDAVVVVDVDADLDLDCRDVYLPSRRDGHDTHTALDLSSDETEMLPGRNILQ